MINQRLSVVSAAVLVLTMQAGQAGPCAPQIDQAQAAVDAKIEATAGAGPFARESTGSLLHRQPTPGSIAETEQKLHEGSRVEAARTALARARDADRADDRSACEQALADVQRAIGP
jgi:hypothetical protein